MNKESLETSLDLISKLEVRIKNKYYENSAKKSKHIKYAKAGKRSLKDLLGYVMLTEKQIFSIYPFNKGNEVGWEVSFVDGSSKTFSHTAG